MTLDDPTTSTDGSAVDRSRAGRKASPIRSPGGTARLLALAIAICLLCPGLAAAGLKPKARLAGAPSARAVLDYWTPARMREAVPVEELGRPPKRRQAAPAASASSTIVPPGLTPPYTASGRIFGRADGYPFYCSGVAVNTPSRTIVLTAGHCLVDVEEGRKVFTNYLEFVPAFEARYQPYGKFVMEEAFVTKAWLQRQNINYDIAAVVTRPNDSGENVADAVGGGADVASNRPRDQVYRIFGYPGFNQQRMRRCTGHLVGHNPESRVFTGLAQTEVSCDLGRGASGGPWFIEGPNGEPLLDGLTSRGGRNYSYGGRVSTAAYFSEETVGSVLAGL
jgi:V8-like Glu-specific endopeptidase